MNKFARLSFAVLIALSSFSCALTAQNQDEHKPATKSPFTVSATPASPSLMLGSSLLVNVKVTNSSSQPALWESYSGNTAYEAFKVSLSRNGAEMPHTAFHRWLRGEPLPADEVKVHANSSSLFSIKPGEVDTFVIDLAKLYTITEAGSYTAIFKHYDEFNGKMDITSGPVVISITRRSWNVLICGVESVSILFMPLLDVC